MTATYTNLYPRDAELNAEYYINTHMPLVAKLLGPSILISWEMFRLPEDAPWVVEIAVTWASIQARQTALETDAGQKLAEDVANFSKTKPIVMLRQPLASYPAK